MRKLGRQIGAFSGFTEFGPTTEN
ncbi:hypothetical protein CISIN_1g0396142mg, partial [Citrus sinensis]